MVIRPFLRSEMEGLLDLFFPHACPLCGLECSSLPASFLCPRCLEGIHPVTHPRCPRCALPYPARNGSDHLCEGCIRESPPFSGVFAAGLYRGALRQAVHRYKYGGALHLDRPLGSLMQQAVEETEPGYRPDLVIPVPLPFRRLKKRTYNQALELARRLGRAWQVPVPPNLLHRTGETAPQLGLSAEERRRNVRGAFAMRGTADGARLLLVDDVLTTGATVRECSRVLLGAGAAEVRVAVLARASRLFF